ncbi:butyrophilin subfamily 1 member A1-like [Epinephelus lanceolatus]|uniref:myelin-oligodendrocyte glycoprotein-like n=1 Tax=Epinephelus lanceolatus TaxID=310571 RepID=UPI0014486C7B|nr:myelin-oligodendrocyte glycoprotein-like [Epinephelus lanceolatus]
MVHITDFMLGFTVPLLTFLVPFTTAARTDVDSQPQVIGSLEPIVAVLGDDVILPCHLEPKFNVQRLTVEWSKPDLKPDPLDPLSRVEYVHLYRDRQEVPDMKIESYIRRTALFTDELREGNISLKIMNVTLADAGRYRCFIPKLKSRVKESVIYLTVVPKTVTTTETPLHPQTPDPNETDVKGGRSNHGLWIFMGVACILLILGSGVAGYLLIHRREKQNHTKYDMASTIALPT